MGLGRPIRLVNMPTAAMPRLFDSNRVGDTYLQVTFPEAAATYLWTSEMVGAICCPLQMINE